MKPGLFTTFMLVIGLSLSAAGCGNTIKGFGKDAANTVNATQSAGKSVAKALK